MADRLVYKGDPSPASGIGFKYELDMNGNRTTITENDGSRTVNTYDDKNRLVNEVRTGASPYSCGYRYDLEPSVPRLKGFAAPRELRLHSRRCSG